MKLRRKLKTFYALTGSQRRLIFEAALMLALARFIILTVPFRLMAPWLRRAPDTGTCDVALLMRVRQAVTITARNVPWNAVCMPQAMAAKAMLARRGRGSAFHLGATLEPDGALSAHAWLVAGGVVVVGGAAIAGMSPLARFG